MATKLYICVPGVIQFESNFHGEEGSEGGMWPLASHVSDTCARRLNYDEPLMPYLYMVRTSNG
jgi:hypothetical protein